MVFWPASRVQTKNSTKSREKAQTAELSEAETILFLVFYAPTIDNREAGAAGAFQEQKVKVLDVSLIFIDRIVRWALFSSSSTSAA